MEGRRWVSRMKLFLNLCPGGGGEDRERNVGNVKNVGYGMEHVAL